MWRDIALCKKQTNLHRSKRSQYIQEKWARVYFHGDTSSGKNIIAGFIYRYMCMHPWEFNDIDLKALLENLSHENKTIAIMGDFNIDLLKYDTEKDSADFLDSMYASFL